MTLLKSSHSQASPMYFFTQPHTEQVPHPNLVILVSGVNIEPGDSCESGDNEKAGDSETAGDTGDFYFLDGSGNSEESGDFGESG